MPSPKECAEGVAARCKGLAALNRPRAEGRERVADPQAVRRFQL